MPHLSNADCQVAMVYFNCMTILLVSAYLDINDPPVPRWLECAVDHANSNRLGVVLCMDTNAHSTLYGPDDNDRGVELEQFLVGAGLWVENRGNTPTFQTIRAESFIDVTATKGVQIYDWLVDTSYNASDHNSILFRMDSLDELAAKEVRLWKKAEWPKFTATLMAPGYDLPEIITCKKLDKMVSYLYSRIEEALDVACPKVMAKVKFQGSKWFTPKLARLNQKVRKQYHSAQNMGTETEWGKYKAIHRKFKRRCRRAKTQKWRHFVIETENEHAMSRLAKIAQHRDRAQLHTLKTPEGTFTAPGKETLCELARVHFPAASTEIPHESYSSERVLTREDREKGLYGDFLSPHGVRSSLNQFKSYKAPGPDGLKAIALKHLPEVVINYVFGIYMACIKLHYTPLLWQQASVVFLPKPNKPHYVAGKFFRPIVLSNIFLKGLERIFTRRMDILMKYYPIHPKQHGFLKGRSTESAISNTVDYIEKCLFKGKTCIGIFLDISSAYDSISIEHIKESLYKHGADIDLTEWYFHYLSHRIISLSLHGDTVKLHTAVGFPQGGVASAKFWLLAFDPAIHIINSMFLEGNGYADDCCIVFGGRKPSVLVKRIQRAVNRLIQWGSTCGLRFNPDKTVVVHFSRKKAMTIPHIKIGNEYVPYSNSAVYLGVTLDAKLTWKLHLQDRVTKSKKYLMKMNSISKAIWGPKPKLSRWVFRCIVRPMIVYASVVWAHSIDRPTLENKLRRLNRMALATMTMFPRSTPTRSVEIMVDLFPLHLWLQKEALCAYIRLAKLLPLTWTGRQDKWKRRNVAHRRFWRDKVEEYEIADLLLEVDQCVVQAPELQFVIRSDSFHANTLYYSTLMSHDWEIFTDGSKKDGQVGSAFMIYYQKELFLSHKFRLPDTASVFQAELYAIFQAVESLLTKLSDTELSIPTGTKCFFFTDSMSALQALMALEIESSLVDRTLRSLNKLATFLVTELYWIKAHNGHARNEAVDQLAKEATEQLWISYVPLPRDQVRAQVIDKLRVIWKLEWQAYPEARHSKLFLFAPDKSRGKQISALNRVDLRRLIMAISNHNNLRYHQAFQDDTINPSCRFCRMYDETFDHFFLCSYFQPSLRYLQSTWPFSEENSWNVEEMVNFINQTEIKGVLDRRELELIIVPEEGEVVPNPDTSEESDMELSD